MKLIKLIYASKVAPTFKKDDINEILEKAKSSNKEDGISGILVFSQKYFLQVLEGGRTEVNRLYNKIIKDDRHSDIIILDYGEINQRSFQEWDMKLYLETNINRKSTLKFSINDEFNPYNMTSESAYLFLREVAK